MSAAARLFAAADLPEDVQGALAAWAQSAVGDRQELRLVPAENLHLTLVFLGARGEEELDALGRTVVEAAAGTGPVEIALGDALWLAPRRPHVLTVAVEDRSGALRALQAAMLGALVERGGHEAEGRMFRPHVTVARARRGARVRPVELPAAPRASFAFPSATLYRSRAGRYEPVARTALTAAASRP